MPNQKLVLFPDTNVFIQCHPLENLDWSEWIEFQEIHLMVCRTVQREVDEQKSHGRDRVARQAQKAYARFRKITESGDEYEVINDSNPDVRLYLDGPGLPSPELKGQLDFSRPDDEIIGHLHRFRKNNPSEDARLLTHDGGPMMTAKYLGLPYLPVQEKWLLQPENNELERENARLKQRVSQLERAEPKFRTEWVNDHRETLHCLTVDFNVFEALSDNDVDDLIEQISRHFPMEDDFEVPKPQREEIALRAARIVGTQWAYTPASSNAISQYTEGDYPEWINHCRGVLSNLHHALQSEEGQPFFTLAAYNEGTRPGSDVLIQISALGDFWVCPPTDPEDETESPLRTDFDLPPDPPKGQWNPISSAIQRLLGPNPEVVRRLQSRMQLNINPKTFSFDRIPIFDPKDPNEFDYKHYDPTKPVKSYTLECQQWRHQTGPTYFSGRIFPGVGNDEVRGALRCEVHAENLSKPIEGKLPVRITINEVNTREYAQGMVQRLIDSASRPEP